MPGTGWLASERYTRTKTPCGLCGCLGMVGRGLDATPGPDTESCFVGSPSSPPPISHHSGPSGFGIFKVCRSRFRWLLYRTPIGGGKDKKVRGIRSFRSRVRDAGSPGTAYNGNPDRPDKPIRAWVHTGADLFFFSLRWRPCVLYIIVQDIIAFGTGLQYRGWDLVRRWSQVLFQIPIP